MAATRGPRRHRPRGHPRQPAPFGRSLAALAACMFGTQGVLTHWFAAAGGQTLSLLALRFIAAGVVFGAFAVANRLPLPPPRESAGAVLTGIAHVAFTTCLLRGFATSSVALTVLLFYTYPLFVAVGAAALYGEPLSRGRVALIALGMVGVALAVGSPSGATPAGVLLGLGAGIGCTAVVLGNRALLQRGLTVPQLSAVSYAAPATAFAFLALAGWVPAPPATVEAWAPALGYLSFATVIPFWLFYTAVSRIGASLASLLATLEPLVGVVLAWLLIDEPLHAGQIMGGALILTAVAMLSVQGRERVSPAATPVARRAT